MSDIAARLRIRAAISPQYFDSGTIKYLEETLPLTRRQALAALHCDAWTFWTRSVKFRSGKRGVMSDVTVRAPGGIRPNGRHGGAARRVRQFLSRQRSGPFRASDFERDALRDGEDRHDAFVAGGDPHLQEGGGARNLENVVGRSLRAAEDLSDVPLVGAAWSEEARGRHAGARGLLHDRARADESELPLLSVVQRRLSQRL